MNKPDLIKAIAEHGKMGRAEAEIALLAVQHTIREALANGRRVPLNGFGVFEVTETAAAKRKVRFKPSAQLKELVNQ